MPVIVSQDGGSHPVPAGSGGSASYSGDDADWGVSTTGTLTVTDGSTTVAAGSIDFTSGATVTDLGGGVAGVAVSATVSEIADLPTAETDTSLVLSPDGSGGVEWRAEAGGSGMPWFNVTAYGMVGDGSTNDRAAANAAIAAYNAAGGGVLYFPAPSVAYLISGGDLTALTAPGLVLGDGIGATVFWVDSATANLFTVSAHGVDFRGLKGLNTASSTPSAGSGLRTTTGAGNHARYTDVEMNGFYIPWNLSYGAEWRMSGCRNIDPVAMSVIQNVDIPDGGDWSMDGCWCGTVKRAGTAFWRIASAGGGKISNLKTNCNSLADQALHGLKEVGNPIDMLLSADTSILKVVNSSFENYTGDAIHADANGHVFSLLSVVGCQFGQYGNGSGRAVYTTGVDDVVIADWELVGGTGTPTAFSLNNGNRGYISPGTNHGFSTLVATSSFTGLVDSSGGGLSDPTTTEGDLVYRHSGSLSRLAVGGGNTVLHGGTDPAYSAVVEADLSLSAVTTGNVSTTKHGFAPVLPNDATRYLDGTGAYSVPPGSGSAIWAPVMVLDPGSGNWLVMTDTSGNAVMAQIG